MRGYLEESYSSPFPPRSFSVIMDANHICSERVLSLSPVELLESSFRVAVFISLYFESSPPLGWAFLMIEELFEGTHAPIGNPQPRLLRVTPHLDSRDSSRMLLRVVSHSCSYELLKEIIGLPS